MSELIAVDSKVQEQSVQTEETRMPSDFRVAQLQDVTNTPEAVQIFTDKFQELLQSDARYQLLLDDLKTRPDLVSDPASDWSEAEVEEFRQETLERFDRYIELLESHLDDITDEVTYEDDLFGASTVLVAKDGNENYLRFIQSQLSSIRSIREDITGDYDSPEGDVYDIRGADRRLSIFNKLLEIQLDDALSGAQNYIDADFRETGDRLSEPENWRDTRSTNLKFGTLGELSDSELDEYIEIVNQGHETTLNAVEEKFGNFGSELIEVIDNTRIIVTSQAQLASPNATASNLRVGDNYLIDFNDPLTELPAEDMVMVLANEYFDIYGREQYPDVISTSEYQLLGFVFHETVIGDEPLSRKEIIRAFSEPMNLYLVDEGWEELSTEELRQLDEVTTLVTGGEFTSFEELKEQARQYEHMSMGNKPDEDEEK